MWDRMMETIRMRRLSRDEHLAALDSKINYHAGRIASETKRLETFIASGGEQRDRKFVPKMQAWLRGEAAAENSVRARREAFHNNPSLPGAAAVSHYFAEALKLGGSNGYWQRPTETFARAFECAVFDALKKSGARSDYLVHGVEPELYADAVWKGNPIRSAMSERPSPHSRLTCRGRSSRSSSQNSSRSPGRFLRRDDQRRGAGVASSSGTR